MHHHSSLVSIRKGLSSFCLKHSVLPASSSSSLKTTRKLITLLPSCSSCSSSSSSSPSFYVASVISSWRRSSSLSSTSSLQFLLQQTSIRRFSSSSSQHESQSAIESRLKREPSNHNLIVEHALSLQERGLIDEAEKEYLRALELAPHSIAVLSHYGTFLAGSRGKYLEAEDLYNRCLRLIPPSHPSLIGIYVNYAILLKSFHQNPEKAEQLLEKAVNIDPQHSEALATWAQIVTEDCIQQTSRRKTESEEYEDSSSSSSSLEERVRLADELHRRAIVADPGNLISQRNYGQFLFEVKKDFSTASSFLRAASVGDPRDLEALLLFTKVLEVSGDNKGARDTYEQGERIHGNNTTFLLAEAHFLYRRDGDFEGAEEKYTKALSLEPENPRIHASYSSYLLLARRNLAAAKRHMAIVTRLISQKRT